jgi:hypothetical protein
MLPAPALKAPAKTVTKLATPLESLQHPLAVYEQWLHALREVAA